ncbi:hypothetical protein JNJ66_05290 [Candidatus Saccharibacteria bacterium]|nr:hypothetical protein [Candidatus Saccharibacteria bacterium]
MIVIPISAIIMGTLYTFMVTLYMNNLKQVGRMDVVSEVNAGLNQMREVIGTGYGPVMALSDGVTDSSAPPGGWAATNEEPYSTLIMAMPATSTVNALDPNRTIIRLAQNGCDVNTMTGNPPFVYNFVFFVKDEKLYRRTLTDTTPPDICGTAAQVPTCPASPGQTSCPKDRLIAENVSRFEVRYQTPTTGYHPNMLCPVGTEPESTEDYLQACEYPDATADATVLTIVLGITRLVDGADYTYSHRFSIKPLGGDVDD